MNQALYLLGALLLTVVAVRKVELGLLITAAVLPLTQWLPPTGITGLNTINLLVLTMGVAALAHRPAKRARSSSSRFPAAVSLLLFSLAIVWSCILAAFILDVPDVPAHAFRPMDAIMRMKSMLTLALLMLLAFWSARSLSTVRRGLAMVVAGMSLEVISGLIEWGRTRSQIVGHVDQYNSLGAFLTIFAAATMALFLTTTTKPRWLYLLLCLGAVFACVQTRSRGGILAAFSSLVLIALLRSRGLFIALLLLGLSHPLWLPAPVLERFNQAYTVDPSGAIRPDDTAGERVEIWKAGLRALKDYPLGVGLSAYGQYSASYGVLGHAGNPDKSAHNAFVNITVEMGPIGLLCFLFLWFSLARSSLRCYVAGREAGLETVGFVGLACLLAVSLANISGSTMFETRIAGPFWMIMGLVCRGDVLLQQARSAAAADQGRSRPPDEPGASKVVPWP